MNLNKITYNEDLTILTQTAQPIRAYAQQANTIGVSSVTVLTIVRKV